MGAETDVAVLQSALPDGGRDGVPGVLDLIVSRTRSFFSAIGNSSAPDGPRGTKVLRTRSAFPSTLNARVLDYNEHSGVWLGM